MSESPLRTKLIAGAGLVCVSTSVGVLYKVSQTGVGGFKYSTTSAICMAEFFKFSMSCGFHILDPTHVEAGKSRVSTALALARRDLSLAAAVQIWILSLLYAINNQLSFYVYMLADPGTIFLFKSASTIIVAAVQCMFAGKTFSPDQWKAMALQACGMIIVQYDSCNSKGLYSTLAYICMCGSTAITAITAARNEHTVKNYRIGLNVQNATLYFGGICLNLFAFFALPNPNSTQGEIGFFEGYDNPLAIGVVVANACIGLAITAVYKYADAVVKCFASDITAVLLIIISAIAFGLRSSLTLWCGVVVVVFAVHSYIDATKAHASAPQKKEADVKPGSIKESELVHRGGTAVATVVGVSNTEKGNGQPKGSEDPGEEAALLEGSKHALASRR